MGDQARLAPVNGYARRELLVGAAGCSVAGLTYAAEPRRILKAFDRGPLNDVIPLSISGRVGRIDGDLVPDKIDSTHATGETVSRSYVEDPSPVMLLVAHHSARSPELKVHRPETCYAVAGFDVTARAPLRLFLAPAEAIPCVSFLGRRGDRTEVVLYWTRVAEMFPQSLTAQRLAFMRSAVSGVRADGLLVRLSTIQNDTLAGLERLRRFARDLYATSARSDRLLLFGPGSPHRSQAPS